MIIAFQRICRKFDQPSLKNLEPFIVRIFLIKAIKFFIALFLLPLIPVVFMGIWQEASRLNERTLYFKNPLSLCLGGLALWTVFALLFRLPSRIYVFAHELSHALFIKLFGGKIKKISVQNQSGYVISDRSNFLIILAPYLFPFYAMILAISCLLLALFLPFKQFDTFTWIGMGVCLGYHWTMTGRMMTTFQSDFSSQGYFFSFVIIVLVNFSMLLLLFLLLPSPHDFLRHLKDLGAMTQNSYLTIFHYFQKLLHSIHWRS